MEHISPSEERRLAGKKAVEERLVIYRLMKEVFEEEEKLKKRKK